MRDDYHSAHYPPCEARPVDGFTGTNGIAFAYDITTPGPLPEQYAYCDVFYSDLPWRTGFDEFNRRADVAGRTYAEFMAAVSRHVDALSAPVVLVTGKHAERLLPSAAWTRSTRLNEHDAVAYGYRLDPPTDNLPTAASVLSWLADRYDCAGDFCCGCGNTGRIFTAAGKRFVMSDVNRRCIGYIADNVFDWTPRTVA